MLRTWLLPASSPGSLPWTPALGPGRDLLPFPPCIPNLITPLHSPPLSILAGTGLIKGLSGPIYKAAVPKRSPTHCRCSAPFKATPFPEGLPFLDPSAPLPHPTTSALSSPHPHPHPHPHRLSLTPTVLAPPQPAAWSPELSLHSLGPEKVLGISLLPLESSFPPTPPPRRPQQLWEPVLPAAHTRGTRPF